MDAISSQSVLESYSQLGDMLDTVSNVITTVLPPLLSIIGLVGNLLSFVLMNQTKYKTSTACYFMRCLAIFDTFYIFGRMLLRYLLSVAPNALLQRSMKKPFCLFYFTVFEFSKFIPPLILTVMTMYRFTAVVWPIKAATLCTMRSAQLSVILISICGAVVGLVQLLRTEQAAYKSWLCPYHFENGRDFYKHAHAIIIGYGPIICLVVFNSGISIAVLRSSKEAKKLSSSGRDSNTEKSITKVGVLVTLFFVITSLPSKFNTIFVDSRMIFGDYSGVTTREMLKIMRFSNNFGITIENLNYCLNFYMYSLTSRRFRKELWDIVSCKHNIQMSQKS